MTSNLGYYTTFTYFTNTGNQNGWTGVAQATMYKSGVSSPIGQLTRTFGSSTITDLAGRVLALIESQP